MDLTDDRGAYSWGGPTLGVPALSTPLCSTVGIDHPVVQAPIGSVSTPELAASVADAGGLGLLAMSWRDEPAIREAYAEATDRTDGVVGINVVLDEATGELPPAECLKICLDAGASVVSLSFGDPAPYLDRIHDAGALALVTVGSAGEARRAVAAGADVVVAQGSEAGGHLQSDVSTMALLPRVAEAVDVPVVAAGGLGDGRGLAAALTMGADGGWLGTRFVATEEAGAHPDYRERVTDADETDTRRTTAFERGWPDQPHRVLTVDRDPDRAGPVASTPDGEPIHHDEDVPPVAGVSGDVSALPHYAGQSAGGIDAVRPAGRVVERVVAETIDALDGAADAVVQ